MRILQINNIAEKKGGAEAVFLNTIDVLRKQGHQVVSLSLGSGNDHNENTFTVNRNSLFHNNFYSWQAVISIEKIISKFDPEVVHIHNLIGGITYSLLPVIKKHNIPIVATIHDFRLLCPAYVFINGKNEECEKCKGGKFYHCVLNKCSPRGLVRSGMLVFESYFRNAFLPFTRLIDSFVFVSNFCGNKFIEIYPDIASKGTTVYNFTNELEKTSRKGEYFLFFGRLLKIKGVITLLNAFKKLPGYNLIIIGNGELEDKIKEYNLPNVKMVGYKEGRELKEFIKDSSFVILPSECNETNSMVVVESFAMGKPVIASRIGAIPELVTDGKNGFLFKPADVDDLINKIKHTADIKENEYSAFSENAYNYSVENFSSQVYYKKILSLYEQARYKKKVHNV